MKIILALCFWIALLSWLVLGTGPAITITGATFMLGLVGLAMAPLARK